MSLPETDKKFRINDISKMILPEMVPEQLQLLGITKNDISNGCFEEACQKEAPGLEKIKLINERARSIKAKNNDLYAEFSTKEKPSQLCLVIENSDIFMYQAKQLLGLLPNTPKNEPIYKIVDQLIETATMVGYSTGSNDSFALTDRYTNSGYNTSVTKPQSGGKSKAQKSENVKTLVNEMARHIYQDENLCAAPKKMLAEAIQKRLADFSIQGNNKAIPALLQFTNRTPEYNSIMKWLKPMKQPKNAIPTPKPSLERIIVELKTAFKPQRIKKHLNI